MSSADCGTCEMLGYRTCDACGQIVFEPHTSPLGVDFCPSCIALRASNR